MQIKPRVSRSTKSLYNEREAERTRGRAPFELMESVIRRSTKTFGYFRNSFIEEQSRGRKEAISVEQIGQEVARPATSR